MTLDSLDNIRNALNKALEERINFQDDHPELLCLESIKHNVTEYYKQNLISDFRFNIILNNLINFVSIPSYLKKEEYLIVSDTITESIFKINEKSISDITFEKIIQSLRISITQHEYKGNTIIFSEIKDFYQDIRITRKSLH